MGNFDGIHPGHLTLIAACIQAADRDKTPSALLTFDPHPSHILRPSHKVPQLMSIEQRLIHLEVTGLDAVWIIPFTEERAKQSAQAFIEEIIIEHLSCQHVLVGKNCRFGHKRQGDGALLHQYGEKYRFDVSIVEMVEDQGECYSSSRIRAALVEGRVEDANQALGYAYFVEGIVEQGMQQARNLGVPTANIRPKENMVQPRFGVYAGYADIGKEQTRYRAIINFGVKPSFEGEKAPIWEAHIIGFDQNLYGEHIFLTLGQFIRDEQRFGSLDDLKAQIQKDLKKAELLWEQDQ